jgi:hypothetical protein
MARRAARPGRRTVRAGATALAPAAALESRIYEVRRLKVMLDSDLAAFYGVQTRVLNQAVRRNPERFPEDFAFRITAAEYESLRSHFVILEHGAAGTRGRGQHRKYLPWAFTEHGALMAAGVLNAPRAVAMSVLIVRAFVRLRRILVSHDELARRLEQLEREFVARSAEHEAHIHRIYEILAELMDPPAPPAKRRIGFVSD